LRKTKFVIWREQSALLTRDSGTETGDFRGPQMAADKKTLHCVVRKYLFCPQLSKFAVASIQTGPLSGFGSDWKCAGLLPPRQEKQIAT
jgi:hypothetical protein